MTDNPWQKIDSKQVLFILDAEHDVEERLLLQWLNNTKAMVDFSGSVSHCVVPIVRDPENIPTQGLQMALESRQTPWWYRSELFGRPHSTR